MKKLIFLNIFLIISNIMCAMYSTSPYIHSRNIGMAYRQSYSQNYNSYQGTYNRTSGIGYSTTYYGYNTYKPSDLSYGYMSDAYTPSSSSKPGIRKVKGYDSGGNVIGDGSPEKGTGLTGWITKDIFWEDGYEYYWDGIYWYRYDGETYQRWESTLGWHWSWFGNSKNPPSGNITRGFPEDPRLSPIGEPIIPTALILLTYFGVKQFKSRKSKQFLF